MLADADGAGAVGGEVLGFGGQLAVGAGEQELVGDETIERRYVGVELGGAEGGFERHDFGVVGSDEDGAKCGERVGHALKLVRGQVARELL